MELHTGIIQPMPKKPLTAQDMGRLGGRARWEKMTEEERASAMKRLNDARWKGRSEEQKKAETEAARIARKKKSRRKKK